MQFYQVDVFAKRAGSGNPLGVVLGGQAWTDAKMQQFAKWTNLVETTYLLPAESADASYRLRIFTPHKEIAFAGHPTIGSAHVALESGFAQGAAGVLQQECAAGILPIAIAGAGSARLLSVKAPTARVLGCHDDPRLHAILRGLSLGALAPALVEGGRRWWMAELGDEATLRAWQPDHAAIGALARASDSLGLCVFARSVSAEHDLVVRAFPAGVGIIEDPASGAANGLIGAYIAQMEPQGALARGYRVSQGREIGHDAQIKIRIEGNDVWVGGQTQTVIMGPLYF